MANETHGFVSPFQNPGGVEEGRGGRGVGEQVKKL